MDAYKDFEYLNGANPPGYEKVTGLERFIRTHGSMYVFLLGIGGLWHIANGTIPKT
jgi:hypothetical protein